MATIADFFINFLKIPKFTFHPVYKNNFALNKDLFQS